MAVPRSHAAERLAPGSDTPPPRVTSAAAVDARSTQRDHSRHRVLWIDDEVHPGDALLQLCALEGFHIDVESSGAEGLATASSQRYDAIIVDLRLPDMFGLTVLQRLRTNGILAPLLAVSGHYLEPEIKEGAMKAGALAFYYKPLDAEEVAVALRTLMVGHIPAMRGRQSASPGAWPYDIVAVSPSMRGVVEWIGRVGPTAACALVTGETGTGKELVARGLHRASARARERFVPVNCAAIPESLVETELFGHRKGAFTGADGEKEGVFEAAHRGVLFLDEIGDLPLSMQGRLLRCLENGEVRRVGETRTQRVDVRIIAATNRSLRADVSQGRFREDLYHRLAVVRQHVPPLRERPEDLEVLVRQWLPEVSARWRSGIVGVSPSAMDLLRAHPWPGNARELRNVLERAVSVSSGEWLGVREITEALSDSIDPTAPCETDVHEPDAVRRLVATLDAHRWNRSRAARALGISRTTLWRWVDRYGLLDRKPERQD
jgi:DNA-binding NtrC family response regulator